MKSTRWWKASTRLAVLAIACVLTFFWLFGTDLKVDRVLLVFRTQSTEKPARSVAKHAPSEPAPVAGPDAPIEESFAGIRSSVSEKPQRLILTGTLVGRARSESAAFIGIDAGNPQTYSAGAMLANGAVLKTIGSDYVDLEKSGRTVRLFAQNVKRRPSFADDLLMVGGLKAAPAAKPTYSERFTEFVRPNPIFDLDKLVGYEVYAGSRSSLFARLGLRPGDVIVAVDGQPVVESLMVMETLGQLATGVDVSVTVRRKEQVERLTLDGAMVFAELNLSPEPSQQPASASDAPVT